MSQKNPLKKYSSHSGLTPPTHRPPYFQPSLTIILFYPGMTSEGGGAVAFPVMTLALGIKPAVARDFSLMIQSCGEYDIECDKYRRSSLIVGMTAAAFTIFWMRIKLEKHSLIFCSSGAFAGMILGL